MTTHTPPQRKPTPQYYSASLTLYSLKRKKSNLVDRFYYHILGFIYNSTRGGRLLLGATLYIRDIQMQTLAQLPQRRIDVVVARSLNAVRTISSGRDSEQCRTSRVSEKVCGNLPSPRPFEASVAFSSRTTWSVAFCGFLPSPSAWRCSCSNSVESPVSTCATSFRRSRRKTFGRTRSVNFISYTNYCHFIVSAMVLLERKTERCIRRLRGRHRVIRGLG